MKRELLFTLFFILTITSYSQDKTVFIKNHKFIFKNILLPNDSGDSIKKVEVFRNNERLLSHTLTEIWEDCNSESVELGTYEVADSSIIFYTYWAKAGDAPVSPYGVRKQIYTVDASGYITLSKGEIYIETSGENWPDRNGVEFLFSKPNNSAERNELKKYISEVEKEYNAKFVFGTAKGRLFQEVKTKLKKPVYAATKNWKRNYTNKIGGYKL